METYWILSEPKSQEKFWDQVDTSSLCWEWKGSKTEDGYGRFRANKRPLRAHRASYILAYGSIPDGLFVCHHCDNPSCVNPLHLYAGTIADNNRDAHTRNRHPGNTKQRRLTIDDVVLIRERYAQGGVSTSQLAKKYGVHQSYLCRLVNGKRRKTAPGALTHKRLEA